MIFPTQSLVVPNGAGTLKVPTASFRWDFGTDVRIPFALTDSAGAPYPLVSGTSLLLGFVARIGAAPLLQLSPDSLTDSAHGKGYFTFPRDLAPTLGTGILLITIGFRDDNVGFEDVCLDVSTVTIDGRAESFDDPITVLPTQLPLAMGPQGVPAYYRRVVHAITSGDVSGGADNLSVPLSPAETDAAYGALAAVAQATDPSNYALTAVCPIPGRQTGQVNVVLSAPTLTVGDIVEIYFQRSTS
jgi:hypothetical protein